MKHFSIIIVLSALIGSFCGSCGKGDDPKPTEKKDVTPPTIEMALPIEFKESEIEGIEDEISIYTRGENLTFTALVSDDNGLDHTDILIKKMDLKSGQYTEMAVPQPWNPDIQTTPLEGKEKSFDNEVVYTIPQNIKAGFYNFRVRAFDKTGNSTSIIRTILIE